jgi:hypothetical protein
MKIVADKIREVHKELQKYHKWMFPTVLIEDGFIGGKKSLHGISNGEDGQMFLAGEPDPDRWQWKSLSELLPIVAQLDQRRIPKDSIVYIDNDDGKYSKQIIDVDKTIEARNKLLLESPDALSQKYSYNHIDYFKGLPKDLEKRMAKADWYYDYSDDHSVWQKGVVEVKGILKDLEKLDKTEKGFEISKSLWDKHGPEHLYRKPDFLNDDIFYKQEVKSMKVQEHDVLKESYSFGLDTEGNIIGKSRGELFKDLDERMKRADWDYSYSDDYTVRRRGEEEVTAIEKDLEILSYSKGGAVIANALWDEHTIRSAIWKPKFLQTAIELQIGKITRQEIALSGHLNQQIMDTNSFKDPNTNNIGMSDKEINHIKNQFKHAGADAAFTPELVDRLKNGEEKITHPYKFTNNGDQNVADFHLSKSKDSGLYFLNKFDLTVTPENSNKEIKETFYLTGQDKNLKLKDGEEKLKQVNKFTLKKAANYLAGRPVFNAFSDKEGNQYEAWAKRKFNVEKGEFEMAKYRKEYPFSLNDATKNYSIKELAIPEQKDRLMESYQRGNLQTVTFVASDGKEEQLYTSLQIGLVKGGSLNVYDLNKDRVAIDQLVEKGYMGKDLAQEIKERLTQKPGDQQLSQKPDSIKPEIKISHKPSIN